MKLSYPLRMKSKISLLLTVAVNLLLSFGVRSSLDVEWKIPRKDEPYGTVTASVGDTITFTYSVGHNVILHPSGTCDGRNDAVFLGSTSPTEYTFDQAGMYTFVCGVAEGAHCAVGQLINVNVTVFEDGVNEEDVDEDAPQEENSDEESTESVDEEEHDQILDKYSQYFNPGEEMGLLEFRMKPYKIPAESTIYINFVFNIPDDVADIVHIVAGDVINSQPKHLHHFVLNGCTEAIDPSREGLPLFRPPRSCGIPLGGWAVGGDLYGSFSSESGMLFGSGLGIKALSLNVHYTDGQDIDPNYANDSTYAIASDGIRILYTPQLRPKTVNLKALINIGSGPEQMNLPPNVPRYFYTKTCTVESSCQDTSDEQMIKFGSPYTCKQAKNFCSVNSGSRRSLLQIYCPQTCGYCNNDEDANPPEYDVSAINYHAHLTGREMYTTLLPKSGDAPIDLESQDLWIFDFQETFQFYDDLQDKPYFKVHPGDKIQTTCIYDSTSRSDTTYFDISTYDEMCITQIHILIDTPDLSAIDATSFLALMNLKSFSCALDDSSDIWGGILEAGEDGREIWKNHPITDAVCTFPVGTFFGGGLALKGDTNPNYDVRCVGSISICNEDTNDIVFNKDATAGVTCYGGSLNEVDSNDISRYTLEGTTTFEELCTKGGGNSLPYTCSDAEDFLNGPDGNNLRPQIVELLKDSWWRPKCCDVPSDAPSQAPSEVPSYSPTNENESPPPLCFSSENTVQLSNGDVKKFDQLELGDEVLVYNEKNSLEQFEPIYSFGHYHPTWQAQFVQLLPSRVEVSSSHLIMLNNGRAVPAGTIQVGDILLSGQVVSGTRIVTRQGIYAPFTSSGNIVVNDGQVVSSFVSLQEESDVLLLGNKWSTGISHQWLAHTFELPHRFWCNTVNMQDCMEESYTSDGVSNWIRAPLKFFTWFLKSHTMIQILLAIPIVCIFASLAFLEYTKNHGSTFFGIMVFFFARRIFNVCGSSK